MATTFKHISAIISDNAGNTIYTTPAGTSAIIFTLNLANDDGTAAVKFNIKLTDNDVGTTTTVGNNISIPAGSTISWPKTVLEENDSIKITAQDVASSEKVTVSASILEIT